VVVTLRNIIKSYNALLITPQIISSILQQQALKIAPPPTAVYGSRRGAK